jgi:hypothetical protein
MDHLKQFRKGALALIFATCLATPATAVWGQTSQFGINRVESADTMDMDLSHQISQAWSEGKDASGAVAFQENGEIAMNSGNSQQARSYFEAAEHELGRLHPSPVSAPTEQ